MATAHDAFISYSHESDGALGPAIERALVPAARRTLELVAAAGGSWLERRLLPDGQACDGRRPPG